MKYTVQVKRTLTQTVEIEVDAINEYDARYLANLQRETLEYDTTDSDYDFEVI